jgi:hypothetical protein
MRLQECAVKITDHILAGAVYGTNGWEPETIENLVAAINDLKNNIR